ncbi:MAG: acyl-CoA dehydrogenase family protein [Acidobacteriota bacterium]|nr:acyl-CoA dehydrogenase family protein [Acidobacteriota bacterium]
MDLGFTEEEEMLRDAVAEVLDKGAPFDKVKEIEMTAEGYDPALWQQLAELEMLGIFFPEQYGGSDLPFIHVAIVMEELGKRAIHCPYMSTVVESGLLITEGGNDRQKEARLPRIAAGELFMSCAFYEEEGGYSKECIQMEAVKDGNDWVLNGSKLFVPDANIAEALIVAARTEEGITLFLTDTRASGVRLDKIPTVGMDNLCRVKFHNLKVSEVLGEVGRGWELVEKVAGKFAAAKCAEMVGGMKTALEMTVGYSKEREQYGRPIGGYQALQHYMANMLMAYDTSFNYLYKVIWKIDASRDYAVDAAALKAYVNQSYNYVAERSIQIHGGIGTTRECDIGLFYRRAKACEYAAGDTRHHLENVAAAMGL